MGVIFRFVSSLVRGFKLFESKKKNNLIYRSSQRQEIMRCLVLILAMALFVAAMAAPATRGEEASENEAPRFILEHGEKLSLNLRERDAAGRGSPGGNVQVDESQPPNFILEKGSNM